MYWFKMVRHVTVWDILGLGEWALLHDRGRQRWWLSVLCSDLWFCQVFGCIKVQTSLIVSKVCVDAKQNLPICQSWGDFTQQPDEVKFAKSIAQDGRAKLVLTWGESKLHGRHIVIRANIVDIMQVRRAKATDMSKRELFVCVWLLF